MSISIKGYLQGALWAEVDLRACMARAAKYREMAERITSAASSVPAAGGFSADGGKVAAGACKLADLAGEMDARADELVRRIADVEELIRGVENPRHRQLLTLRYLAGQRWPDITRAMRCEDVRAVYRLHGRALQSAENNRKNHRRNLK